MDHSEAEKLKSELEAARKRIAEMEAAHAALQARFVATHQELALFRTLMDNIPDTIYFKDQESRFTWINLAQARVLGVAHPRDALGKTDADFFSPEHAREAREDEMRVMRLGLPVLDKVERDNLADGTPRWVSTTKIPTYDAHGRAIGTCGISRDISERKRVEEELSRESSLLNALMENIPDAIYFKDTESRFLKVSRFIHLKGITRPEDAIGKTDFDFFTEEHARQAFEDEQEILRTGRPIVDKVERETFGEGEDVWVSTTKVPLRDREGRVTGLVGISRDITARRKAEEALQKAKEELEIRVQERTAALVQEIKEHMRMEKALKDSERKLQESNQRLEARVDQLDYLNATSHKLAHHTHRRNLLPAIIEAFTSLHPGVEASLCEAGREGYRCVAASPGLDTPAGREAAERALDPYAGSGLFAPVLIRDRAQDSHLASLAWPAPEGLATYAALPFLVEERCLAVLQLLAPPEFAEWRANAQPVLNTLAAQAALSLSNANNFQELEKRARLEGELEVAQRIQRRFTPQDRPSIPRVNLKGVYYPAYEVGGDYLDYFQTDSGNWVIVVADVSGKGIPAALLMTMLRSTFRAEARYETSAKQLLCAVNDLMIQDLDAKEFITALCLIVDREGRSMSYARAGHPPLLFKLGGQGGQPASVNPKGIALGMVDTETFSRILEEVSFPLQSGDRFLIFTDGLLEAMDPERKTYGIKRLLSLLAVEKENDPDRMLKRILEDVQVFTRSEPYHDDLTILAMQVTG